jgi:hypothetical protein
MVWSKEAGWQLSASGDATHFTLVDMILFPELFSQTTSILW